MPDASVVIQVSSQGGARMQEAQRLGRFLRRKTRKRRGGEPDAHFVTLVSQDTIEERDNTKRKRYLVEQGYAYHCIGPNDSVNDVAIVEQKRITQLGYRAARSLSDAEVKEVRDPRLQPWTPAAAIAL